MRPFHRYLKEVDCSSGEFKLAKLEDKKYTINALCVHFQYFDLQNKTSLNYSNVYFGLAYGGTRKEVFVMYYNDTLHIYNNYLIYFLVNLLL